MPYGIFLLFFITRVGFKWVSGFDNFELHADTLRYDQLSDNILQGNFNLDVVAFIVAPLYPYFLAFIKWGFGSQWEFWAVALQLSIVSLSGVYLYRLAILLFQKTRIALFAAFAYCFFPSTMWLNFSFTQETLFQSFFIMANYHLVRACYCWEGKHFYFSALLFSLAFLTKSHALIYAPFIVVTIFLCNSYSTSEKFKYSIIYGLICFGLTLPYGLYNLQENGVYTLSSYGLATFFHNGKSEGTYQEIIHPPPIASTGQPRGGVLDFIFEPDYFHEGYGQINRLPQAEKNALHFEMALNWIKNNPEKFMELEWYSFRRYFTPGVSCRHNTKSKWLASLIISLPVYFFAYIGIFLSFKSDFKKHFWMFGVMLTMFIFFMTFMPQSRFRTITLEPYYILYAAFGFFSSLQFIQHENTSPKRLFSFIRSDNRSNYWRSRRQMDFLCQTGLWRASPG